MLSSLELAGGDIPYTTGMAFLEHGKWVLEHVMSWTSNMRHRDTSNIKTNYLHRFILCLYKPYLIEVHLVKACMPARAACPCY
jgi:hypothetical protein